MRFLRPKFDITLRDKIEKRKRTNAVRIQEVTQEVI
jgi:hypothetical protein